MAKTVAKKAAKAPKASLVKKTKKKAVVKKAATKPVRAKKTTAKKPAKSKAAPKKNKGVFTMQFGSDDELQKNHQHAKERGMQLSGLIRASIADFVANHPVSAS